MRSFGWGYKPRSGAGNDGDQPGQKNLWNCLGLGSSGKDQLRSGMERRAGMRPPATKWCGNRAMGVKTENRAMGVETELSQH